jgi:hypothetical protein
MSWDEVPDEAGALQHAVSDRLMGAPLAGLVYGVVQP